MTLVVLERGSDWPVWAQAFPLGAVVLIQQPFETALAFARRTVRRIAHLSAESLALDSTVLAVGPDTSDASFDARWLIVQAAVRSAPEPTLADVHITTTARTPPSVNDELVGLVASLQEELPESGVVNVTVEDRLPGGAALA